MKIKKHSCLDKFNEVYERIIKEDTFKDWRKNDSDGRLSPEDEKRLFAIGFRSAYDGPEDLNGYFWTEDPEGDEADWGVWHGMNLSVWPTDSTDMALIIHNYLVYYADSLADSTICEGNFESLDEFLAAAKPAFEKYIQDGKLDELEEGVLAENPDADRSELKKAKAQVLRFWKKFKTL